MKNMPNPIQVIRQIIHIIDVVGKSGTRILRLVVTIISVATAVIQEIRTKK